MAVDHAVPFFALITCIGIILSSIWHVRAKNWTIVIFAGWLLLWNFVLFVNAMIWWDNDVNRAPVFCDISVKLTSMWTIGVPAASLCVSRKLEAIASTRVVSATPKEKQKDLLIDLFISFVIPFLYGVLSIVYQGHRFDIIGGIGCNPAVYVSWPYVLLGIIPPPLIALVSLGYAVMALRHFYIRRKQFSAVLCSNGSNLNKSRYFRMMALCFSEILINVPLLIALQLLAAQQYGIWFKPYISWAYVHADFARVLNIPSSVFDWPDAHRAWIVSEISRWLAPVSGGLLIVFFGFNNDAVQEYRNLGLLCKKSIKKMFVRKKQLNQQTSIIGDFPNLNQQTSITSTYPHNNTVELPPLTPQTDVGSTFEYKAEKDLEMSQSDQPLTSRYVDVHVHSVRSQF